MAKSWEPIVYPIIQWYFIIDYLYVHVFTQLTEPKRMAFQTLIASYLWYGLNESDSSEGRANEACWVAECRQKLPETQTRWRDDNEITEKGKKSDTWSKKNTTQFRNVFQLPSWQVSNLRDMKWNLFDSMKENSKCSINRSQVVSLVWNLRNVSSLLVLCRSLTDWLIDLWKSTQLSSDRFLDISLMTFCCWSHSRTFGSLSCFSYQFKVKRCWYLGIYSFGPMSRFIDLVGPGDLDSIPGHVIPKTLKMVLDTSLLYTQQIRYVSGVKWSNPGKGAVPFPTPRCSSYWKGSLRVSLDYGR